MREQLTMVSKSRPPSRYSPHENSSADGEYLQIHLACFRRGSGCLVWRSRGAAFVTATEGRFVKSAPAVAEDGASVGLL
jgi:hypothetical protein